MNKIKTGIREAFDGGYQAWFTIGNQIFYLQECEDEKGMTSKEKAKWYEKSLITAFKKLDQSEQKGEGKKPKELQTQMTNYGGVLRH